ncbi:MAG: pseudouridine-5'-phosphate glycosidase, partial [Chloroflexi bacterium]|nr:pseudouridine-5'-phosphate glycosidase [Chloroflexota bacterium]
MKKLPPYYKIDPEVSAALRSGLPVVALESTVITHGLPYPENVDLAKDMESEVRAEKAVPATISMLDGRLLIGTQDKELSELAQDQNARKISVRDFAPAIVQKANGGTTVAGTLIAAEAVGIQVFATGGIGGVHRNAPFDVSTDLGQLAQSPVVVVCAGAKAILDLPATIEKLEPLGVPV